MFGIEKEAKESCSSQVTSLMEVGLKCQITPSLDIVKTKTRKIFYPLLLHWIHAIVLYQKCFPFDELF